jgi:hypothetical protein
LEKLLSLTISSLKLTRSGESTVNSFKESSSSRVKSNMLISFFLSPYNVRKIHNKKAGNKAFITAVALRYLGKPVATIKYFLTTVATIKYLGTPTARSKYLGTPIATLKYFEMSVATIKYLEKPTARSKYLGTPITTLKYFGTSVANQNYISE